WTNRTLHEQSYAVACALTSLGVKPDDRVVLCLPNCVETIVPFTATLLAGGVVVPVFGGTVVHDIRHIVADCAPAVLVATSDFASRTDAMQWLPRHRFVIGAGGVP